MQNNLEISEPTFGSYQTDIVTSDNVTCMQIHRHGLTDIEILQKLIAAKHYQNFAGTWTITIPAEQKVFSGKDFNTVANLAINYMHERNNPRDYEYYC